MTYTVSDSSSAAGRFRGGVASWGALLLATLCATLACQRTSPRSASGVPPGGAPSAVSAHLQRATQPIRPTVVVVTSAVSCDGGIEVPIAEQVADDAVLLRTVLEPYVDEQHFVRVDSGSADAIQAAITNADPNQGLWLFYSGHGHVTEGEAGVEGGSPLGVGARSLLCLPTKDASDYASDVAPLPVEQVLEWVEQRAFPWATVVLNACESAHVDVSGFEHPISVISASPEEVEALATPAQTVVDGAPNASQLIEALGAAVQAGAAVDSNCDGWISDRELLEHAIARLAGIIPLTEHGYLMPRLKRQASTPLPLFSVQLSPSCRDVQLSLPDDLIDNQLGHQLAAQLDPIGGLPNAGADFFVLDDPAAHQACLALASGLSPPVVAASQREQQLTTCSVLLAGGLVPLPASVAPHVTSVARIMRFAEIFRVHWDADWVHLDRLRDERRMASRKGVLDSSSVPQREQVLSTWPSGGVLTRYTHRVVHSREREVTVCPETEGQCFFDP